LGAALRVAFFAVRFGAAFLAAFLGAVFLAAFLGATLRLVFFAVRRAGLLGFLAISTTFWS
ncbi:MAG: hypothetical protein ACE5GT_08400, partial [Rhodospirillales bacterium]